MNIFTKVLCGSVACAVNAVIWGGGVDFSDGVNALPVSVYSMEAVSVTHPGVSIPPEVNQAALQYRSIENVMRFIPGGELHPFPEGIDWCEFADFTTENITSDGARAQGLEKRVVGQCSTLPTDNPEAENKRLRKRFPWHDPKALRTKAQFLRVVSVMLEIEAAARYGLKIAQMPKNGPAA